MAKRKRKRKKKLKNKEITFTKFLICVLLIFAGFFILLYFSVFIGIFGKIPSIEELKNIQNYLASEVYSADNTLLGKYYIQNRTNVAYDDIPDYFIDALVATEDVRFYTHNGIDKKSIFRVFFKTILLQKESAGGGSTISQQLAKNLYPRKNYFIVTIPVNKFREMITAVRLEKAYSKKDILELYLNTVSFGENTFGIETASQRFFKKHPKNLKIEEAALLVGLLKATNIFNPHTQPKNALQRRNVVLAQMVKYGKLDTEEADSLKKLEIKLNYIRISHNEGPAPYFRERLRTELLEWCKKNPKPDGSRYNIYTDGLKIYTSINADLQRYAEEAVKTHMKYLQNIFDQHWSNRKPWGKNEKILMNEIKKSNRYQQLHKRGKSHKEIMKIMSTPVKSTIFTWNGKKEKLISPIDSIAHYFKFLHAGLLAIEAKTGYIRAWVGGINHQYFQYDHVTARRQPGSVFKPVVYAAALENGHEPCNYIANDSVVYENYDNWTPRNADWTYGGYYSMKGALTHSVNTVSVNLLMETGFNKVKSLAKNMGISSDLPEVPSLALGTGEVSLFEMVRAYSVFLNKGKLVKLIYLKRIEDKFGNVLYETRPELGEKKIISPENADIMLEMLKGVVNNGTAASLRTVYGLYNDIAGKTGTTQMHTDGWFIGFTPDLITGIWVGGDNPVIRFRSLSLGQGSHTAIPIWARFTQKIYSNPLYRFSKNSTFNISEEALTSLYCPDYKEDNPEKLEDFLKQKGESIIDLIKRVLRKKDRKRKNDKD